MFKTEMSVHQPKVNLDDEIFYDKIALRLDQEIRKLLVRDLYGN